MRIVGERVQRLKTRLIKTMIDLLKTTPHTEVQVSASYSSQSEKATSDDEGVLRDEQGRAYSKGVYEIVGQTSKHNLSAQEFGVLLRLLMVSDPWPLSELDRDTLVEVLNEESRSRNYDDWTHAYHEMCE